MNSRLLLSAAVASVALVAAPVVSIPVAQAAPTPVEPQVEVVDLPDGEEATTRIDVPDGTTVMGVTWQGEPAASPDVRVRALRDGAWGEWVSVPGNDEGPDAGTAEAAAARAAGGVQATDPVDVAGAEQVEVRTADAEQVTGLEAALVDPGASAADAAVSGATPLATADAAAARPSVVSRKAWGADESLRSCTPKAASALRGVIVHHTADRNTYSREQAPAMVRSIYAYHTKVQKWCDVGYNALIDRYGTIYEGRYGGLERNVIGAHAGGFNSGTWGVSVIGNFEAAALPAVAQASLEKLVAWRLGVAGISPSGSMSLTSGGSTKYAAGKVVKLPVVAAHRDVGLTACPGADYYARMGTIRANVTKLAKATAAPAPAPAPAPVTSTSSASSRLSDFTGDTRVDVLARSDVGGLYLFPTAGGVFTGGSRIGHGWGAMTSLVAAGDVTGDGHGDVYARAADGRLWLYPSNGRSGWQAARVVGWGWNGMDEILAVADWDGDGRNDIAARNSSGRLWLYPTNRDGSFGAAKEIGRGWAGIRAPFGAGDFDGDGNADILGRDAGGRLVMYAGDGRGGFKTSRAVGWGWGAFTAVLSVGDFDGKGNPDVLARDGSGRLWLYPGDGRGGWLAPKLAGTRWDPFTAIF